MPRLRIAAITIAFAALGIAPATAQATVTSSQITSWVSQSTDAHGHTTTITNGSYLISLDNPPATTLDVSGTATATSSQDTVDVVCVFGGTPQYLKLMSNVPVVSGTFDTHAVALRPIAGHACRLRAVPAGMESVEGDSSNFAGPQVAVSEAALPSASFSSNPYNIYVNAVTFTGDAAWKAAGSNGCGPYSAPIDGAFDIGTFPIDCAGSLLSDDLNVWGGRSEVQIDGRNAYDAASAQSLFTAANGNPASQSLSGFPALSWSVSWDQTNGLMTTTTTESWAMCNGANAEKPSYGTCSSFQNTGVQLDRSITTSDGGRVITMTDTWHSTDGRPHSLDLLYDDYAGVFGKATGERGWQFPGQSSFSQYGTGDAVSAPAGTPGSILVHTNVAAADGDPNEGFGAITYSNAPSGFRFASNSELEEHNVLSVPAAGGASLTYIYSVGYTQADVAELALAAQDRLKPLSVSVTSPASGVTVSSPAVTLTGTATAGSGIRSLVVGGQGVPVASDGTWNVSVPLNAGANSISVLATDGAGATAQGALTVTYQPPPPPPPPPAPKCKVPRVKNMKLRNAERALRRAHCRVGKIKHVGSRKIARGRVMSTMPRAGRRLPDGAKVELFVSKGS